MSAANPKMSHTSSPRPGKGSAAAFSGYPAPTSNTTYVPNQFLDVVLKRASRGTVRLVGYMLRRILGWSNEDGSPRETQVRFSYTELIQGANISNGAIREALNEALAARYIVCIENGKRNSSGAVGKSATYELRWDDSEQYKTDPGTFQGFFAGNGNRTYIPNAFFDHTIRNESLAVARVVGAVIRHTIAFQDRYGFRRTHKDLSFDDLLRITRLNSRSTLNDAIKVAIRNCHLVRLKTGTFSNGGFEKSTYAIRWEDTVHNQGEVTVETPSENETRQNPNQGNKGFLGVFDTPTNSDTPKSEPRSTPKSEPRTAQKPNQERAKNRTYLEITKNNSPKEQQQKGAKTAPPTDSTIDAAVVVFRATSLLKDVGFMDKDAITIVQNKVRELRSSLAAESDETNVDLLAATKTEELIQNQIRWLPKRTVTKSKLGMLRSAIEGDFGDPEKSLSKEDETGLVFAKSYYAGYSGSGQKSVEPFPRDPGLASQFLASLKLSDQQPEELGRSFGRFVRERHASDRNAKPFLSSAINIYGEPFAKVLQARAAKKLEDQKAKAMKAHEESFQKDYRDYLKQCALDLRNKPALLEEFEDEQRQQAAIMKKMGFDPKKFMSAEGRVEAIAEHFRNHKQFKVLSFWDWDQELNPNGFGPKKTGPKAHLKTANA